MTLYTTNGKVVLSVWLWYSLTPNSADDVLLAALLYTCFIPTIMLLTLSIRRCFHLWHHLRPDVENPKVLQIHHRVLNDPLQHIVRNRCPEFLPKSSYFPCHGLKYQYCHEVCLSLPGRLLLHAHEHLGLTFQETHCTTYPAGAHQIHLS